MYTQDLCFPTQRHAGTPFVVMVTSYIACEHAPLPPSSFSPPFLPLSSHLSFLPLSSHLSFLPTTFGSLPLFFPFSFLSHSQRQRSHIPCYWETQPVGCLKPHCPFKHSKPRPALPGTFDRLTQYKEKGGKPSWLEERKREGREGWREEGEGWREGGKRERKKRGRDREKRKDEEEREWRTMECFNLI